MRSRIRRRSVLILVSAGSARVRHRRCCRLRAPWRDIDYPSREAWQHVLHLAKGDLRLASAGLAVLGEDVEDQAVGPTTLTLTASPAR